MSAAVDHAYPPFSARLYQDHDLQGALNLWKNESGWGELTATEWKEWYRDTPFGDCVIVVATDSRDELIAQIVFHPSLVRIGGRDAVAYRTSSPILARSLKSIPIASPDHPLKPMFSIGLTETVMRGAELAYAMPWEKWLPLIDNAARRGTITPRTITATIPCVGFARPMWNSIRGEGSATLSVSEIRGFTAEHARLWERAAESTPFICSVVRTPRSLDFRQASGIALEVRDAGSDELIGYATIRKTSGLVTDLIVSDPERVIEAVGAIAEKLDRLSSDAVSFNEIQFMETAYLRVLETSPACTPVDFNFGFFAILLGDGNDAALDVCNWYLTPSD